MLGPGQEHRKNHHRLRAKPDLDQDAGSPAQPGLDEAEQQEAPHERVGEGSKSPLPEGIDKSADDHGAEQKVVQPEPQAVLFGGIREI